LAYNATVISIIGMSPFYANYGFNLKVSWKARDIKHLIKAAMIKADKLKDLHQELFKDIE
jgi:hypothetical protein